MLRAVGYTIKFIGIRKNYLIIRMQEKGTLKIEDFVVYKLKLCEHPVALLELR